MKVISTLYMEIRTIMLAAEASKLQPGDEVYWFDPDEGRCSRYLTIASIEVIGQVVKIATPHGDSLECFAEELS